jgi:hypothetical protein
VPTNPTVTADDTAGVVTVTLPDPTTYVADPDLWEIKRKAGDSGGSTDLTGAVTVATIPATRATWRDRAPHAFKSTYWIRARSTSSRTWSAWSTGVASPTATVSRRGSLTSPMNVLEIQPSDTTGKRIGAETASSSRFVVQGSAPWEVLVLYRASLQSASDGQLLVGLRWYDRRGTFVGEDTLTTQLAKVNSENITDTASLVASPPSGAEKVGIFIELSNAVSTSTKVRIENLELYREDPLHNSGWEYIQVPGADGVHPDEREPILDQTIFSYTGVGWTPLTPAPSAAPDFLPYRETASAQDSFAFLVASSSFGLLFHGTGQAARIALEHLGDSVIGRTSVKADESDLWQPTPLENSTGGTIVRSSDQVANSAFDEGTLGWENQRDENHTYENGITFSAPSGPWPPMTSVSGTLQTAFKNQGEGVSQRLSGHTYVAGHTYRLRVKLWKTQSATTAVKVAFGSSTPYYNPSPGGADYLHDRTTLSLADLVLNSPSTEYTLYWTPLRDQNFGYVAILGDQNNSAYDHLLRIDDVVVDEIIAIDLPNVTVGTEINLKVPGVFPGQHATAHRVTLLSGKIRPKGLAVDTATHLDVQQDFLTVLRSLGEIRNASRGELVFHAETDPPLVKHVGKRGRDHSKVEGGLDLRFGKNITTRKRTRDATQVANRIVVVGYGEDQTQLVIEAQSLLDVQGRVPSDPLYRHDARGLPPTDSTWDRLTGGTSEDIYGPRYGVFRNAQLTTTHQAQLVGQLVAEKSAWPLEAYDVTLVDLATIPADLEPGDQVMIRYGGRDLKRRIIEIAPDASRPGQLNLTLGDDIPEMAEQLERVSRDVDVALSWLNNQGGS